MLVSIITVSFNSSKTISDTIKSVLNQSYKNIEYIIVDGNSSDDTMSIVDSFKDQFDGRLKCISEKDNGLYDAMNKGILLATGDIVGTLNSDDFFGSNFIVDEIVKTFNQNKIQAVFGDVKYVDYYNTENVKRFYSSSFFKPMLFKFGFMPAHPTFYTYRNNYNLLGLYNLSYRIAADYELLLRFLLLYKISYMYNAKVQVVMRLGGKSTKSIRSNFILNSEILTACKSNNVYTNYLFIFSKYLIKVFELLKLK
jgi:glycosyltransferase involved in cell wall biosynthesis